MPDNNEIPFILLWLHKKAVYLPHLMAALSVLVSVGLFAIGRGDLFQYAGFVLIPLFIISVILIFNKNLKCNDSAFFLPISQKILIRLYIIITAILFAWTICGHFDILRLIILGLSYLIMLVQIFSKNLSVKPLLLEIVVTTALLTIPQLFYGGYFYGDTDIISHSNYVNLIASIGTINDASLGAYQPFCLSHISGAICSLLSGLSGIHSYSLICSIVILCAIPFVYLLASYFLKSDRLAILSTFIYAILPMTLSSITYNPAPRMLATVVFFIILYVIFSLSKRALIASILITLILVFYLSGVHHAQIILLFTVLAFLVLGCLLYYKKVTLGHIIPFLLLLTIPVIWQVYNYISSLVLGIFNGRLFAMFDSGAIGDSAFSSSTSEISDITIQNIIFNLPSAIVTVFIFVALVVLFTKIKHPKKISILLPMFLLLFVAFVPIVLDSFPAIANAFQLYRFRLCLTTFFAIAIAIGCVALLNIPKKKRGKIVSIAIVMTLIGLLIFSSAIVYNNKYTNDIFQNPEWTNTANHFRENDMAMFNTLLLYGPDNTKLSSDFDYTSYLNRQLNVPTLGYRHPFTIVSNLLPAFSELTDLSDTQYVIFPESRFKKLTLRIFERESDYIESDFKYIPYNKDVYNWLMNNLYLFNLFYDNQDNKVFAH